MRQRKNGNSSSSSFYIHIRYFQTSDCQVYDHVFSAGSWQRQQCNGKAIPSFYQAVNSHTWVASMVASFLLWALVSVIQGAIRGESRAVFTSQDTTPALQTCSKMSPEQGRTTGAARTPRNTINYQGNIYEIFSSILFPFVTIRRRINSRVDYEFVMIF